MFFSYTNIFVYELKSLVDFYVRFCSLLSSVVRNLRFSGRQVFNIMQFLLLTSKQSSNFIKLMADKYIILVYMCDPGSFYMETIDAVVGECIR